MRTVTAANAPGGCRVKVVHAYRFALSPSPAQVEALLSHCGAARLAFNWSLARVKAALSQRDVEKTYGIAAEVLTEVPWKLYALRRAWNQAKTQVAPWWPENSKEKREPQNRGTLTPQGASYPDRAHIRSRSG